MDIKQSKAIITGGASGLGLATAEMIVNHGGKVNIIDVSGHTLGQIAYHFPEEKLLFSGDCLFRLGCGYIFEGDPEMMQKSFSRIKDLGAIRVVKE